MNNQKFHLIYIESKTYELHSLIDLIKGDFVHSRRLLIFKFNLFLEIFSGFAKYSLRSNLRVRIELNLGR